MLKKHLEKRPLTPFSKFSYKIQQLYLFVRTWLVHESQGVTCTAQDQDDYVMSQNECHDLLYEKLYYHIIHRNNKVTTGEHQYHSNTPPDQQMGYAWLHQVNSTQYMYQLARDNDSSV